MEAVAPLLAREKTGNAMWHPHFFIRRMCHFDASGHKFNHLRL
jgi:hypothetical protein